MPSHLVDLDEPGIVAGWLRVGDADLKAETARDERVDELVPLLVAVDDRIEVVAERKAQHARAEEVVDLGEGEPTRGSPRVVDGDVRFHLEAIRVGDRGEPRRRAEEAAARRQHELAPGRVVARIDGADHQRAPSPRMTVVGVLQRILMSSQIE